MIGSELVTRRQISENYEPRPLGCTPHLIVLHYTGMASGNAAVDWLCNPASKVSSHYLVNEDGSIVQMVSEQHRAWHAGVSSWHGAVDINSASIGIEIQNGGHGAGLPPFPQAQMRSVALLCLDIMARYTIACHDVVAHSDVAPGRKVDPGEAFDWDFLAAHGVGQVVRGRTDANLGTVEEYQTLLAASGYGVELDGSFDLRTRIVTEAVQRRYRRSCVDGVLDAETFDIVRRLQAAMPLLPVA